MKKLLFLLPLVGLMACEKAHVEKNVLVSNGNLVVENYSEFGIAHNNLLDYVAANSSFDNLSQEEVFNYCQTFDNEYLTGSSINFATFEEKLDYTKDLIDDVSNSGTELLSDSIIKSTVLANYINDLGAIYALALDTLNNSVLSPESFDDLVNELISEIKDNQTIAMNWDNLEGNEFAAMLAMCEIAKSSYAYWYTVASDSEHLWYYRLSTQQFKTAGWIKDAWTAVKRAAVDTWGFMTADECGYWTNNGGIYVYHYNLGCAASAAGEASAGVN